LPARHNSDKTMTADAQIPLIIAEAGVNHNGSRTLALELVDAAAEAGADVVKFQTFRADESVAANAPTCTYQAANTGKDNQYELLKELELELEDFSDLAARCTLKGVGFLSTPFDKSAVGYLLGLGMQYIKVPSGELVNDVALRHFAQFRTPILLSTGMATLEEVAHAVDILERGGSGAITLLHCTSLYPAPPETLNLRAIKTLRDRFDRPIGYSDHSLGTYAPIAATALGAAVIEKHFTLDRRLSGPDHAASLIPDEFADMVQLVRQTAAAMGDGIKKPAPAELDTARVVRRSWRVARDLPAGAVLSESDCVLKRPNDGLSPAQPPFGRRLVGALAAGDPIREADLA
jgi:N,N'-diacetyllegionaminate synthase